MVVADAGVRNVPSDQSGIDPPGCGAESGRFDLTRCTGEDARQLSRITRPANTNFAFDRTCHDAGIQPTGPKTDTPQVRRSGDCKNAPPHPRPER